jgi:hypothetical protein
VAAEALGRVHPGEQRNLPRTRLGQPVDTERRIQAKSRCALSDEREGFRDDAPSFKESAQDGSVGDSERVA